MRAVPVVTDHDQQRATRPQLLTWPLPRIWTERAADWANAERTPCDCVARANAWKARAAAATEQLTDVFEDCEDHLGPVGVRRVRSALSSVSLTSHQTVEELSSLLVLADLADRADVFFGGLEVLRPVPWTGDYSAYEPIRRCSAARRAERTDLDPAPYRDMISLPELGAPAPPSPIAEIRSRASGSMLNQLRTRAAKAETSVTHPSPSPASKSASSI